MDSSPAGTAPSRLPAAVQLPDFGYDYPPDFPRAYEHAMDPALSDADQHFADEWLTAEQFGKIQTVRENWFWQVVKAYEEKLRQVAITSRGREKELRRFAEAAAAAVRLTRPRRERLFASERWRAILTSSARARPPPGTAPAAELDRRCPAPPTATPAGESIARVRRGRPRTTPNCHPEVEPFLETVSASAHRLITITDFCLISGFTDDTVFGA